MLARTNVRLYLWVKQINLYIIITVGHIPVEYDCGLYQYCPTEKWHTYTMVDTLLIVPGCPHHLYPCKRLCCLMSIVQQLSELRQ